MAAVRKSISKKVRFEVFKRDSFTCQYCGKSAPDVVLHVDHIHPVAKGGQNDPMNYITSCAYCNMGKGAKTLDDNSVLAKQKKQLDDLNERREQLKLMVQWKESLSKLDDELVTSIQDMFYEGTKFVFSEHGKATIRKLIKKYTFEVVYDSAQASRSHYVEDYSEKSYQKAFDYIGRICACKQKDKDKPHMKDLYYIRGILKNRLSRVVEWRCMDLLEEAFDDGIEIERLKHIAKTARHWTGWQEWMLEELGYEV